MSLHEMIYVSLADHPMSPTELRELLEQSRSYNREHGITGLLIYRDREFLQFIEGEQAELQSLFQRIERDPRHQQVYPIWDGPIAARTCGDWAMGCAELDDATLQALPDGRLVLDEGLFTVGQSSAGKRLLLRLRDELLLRAVS
jgi:hypothetical protein